MPTLNYLFGNNPDRPDTYDFWKLSEIVLQMDGRATECPDGFEKMLNEMVDPTSLVYMANQRAMRLMGTSLISLSSLYIDGFTAGYHFAQRKNKK